MDFFLRIPRRQLEQLIGLLIILGYVDINVFTVRKNFFAFVLRGPIFTRLTSGASQTLRLPGNSPRGSIVNRSFIKLEALLAYLLLSGIAYIQNPTVVGSGIVFTVQSDLFTLQSVQHILSQKENTGTERIVLALLNLGIGLGLMQNTFGITGTAYGPFPYQLGFSTTSTLVEPRQQSNTPGGLAAIPNGGPTYRWFNRVVGFMLAIQQLCIYSVSISKGGSLVFGISGSNLALRSVHRLLDKTK